MKSHMTRKKWAGIVMIVALMCNMIGGMKLFCGSEKPRSETVAHPVVVGVLTDDQVSAEESISQVVQVAQYEGQPPRCKCKKNKPCSAISRVIVISSPVQRFNEYQRHAWSQSSHFVDVVDLRVSITLCGSNALYSSRWDICVHEATPGKLDLSCVLLI